MDLTLLESFIERKTRAYAEPSRRGTSKGEPVGFSRKKYLATLYMLTADKQITIAMELGISYGLLRKWNTEKPFRAMLRKHCREFADIFVRYVVDTYERQEKAREGYLDSRDYSPELLAEILKSAVNFAEKAEKVDAFARAFAMLSAFLELVTAIGPKAVEEISRKAGIDLLVLARGVKLGAIERVKNLLMKKGIDNDERTEACYLLDQLKKTI